MDKNLLRAQLLMEAADLLNEETYEDCEDFEDYDDYIYEELDESYRKPNTNERYALAKGYVKDKEELVERDDAKVFYHEDPRAYAPGVAYAKYEMENNRRSNFVPHAQCKLKDCGDENTRKRWLKLQPRTKALLNRADKFLKNKKNEYYKYPRPKDAIGKALNDRWDAANKKYNDITISHMENYGWAPKYNDKRGTYRRLEDLPEAHWKKTVKAEGKDPWRQYPGK